MEQPYSKTQQNGKLSLPRFRARWKQRFADANFSGREMILTGQFFAARSPGMERCASVLVNNAKPLEKLDPFKKVVTYTRRSGYCYLNKGECILNQSKDDPFVERVAKNNSWNNGDHHKIHEIFLINCFVLVIGLVWKTVHSSAMTQIKTHLMEKHFN